MAIALIFLTFSCGIPGANSFHQLEKGFIYQSTHKQSRSVANKILDGLLPEITVILEVYYVLNGTDWLRAFLDETSYLITMCHRTVRRQGRNWGKTLSRLICLIFTKVKIDHNHCIVNRKKN